MASPSVASRSKHSARSIETDDAVLARAMQFSAWARQNARVIIVLAVLALGGVGSYIYYRIYQAQRAERASIRFMEVERTALSGNATLAQRDLADFARRYDGTDEADEARLMLAKTYLDAGQPKKALPVLQEVGDNLKSPIGVQGAELLATAQAQSGDREAAVQTYQRIADGAKMDFQREDALQNAALLREQAGNWAGAAEMWRKLVDGAKEDSFQRSLYEMRLAEAEGHAQGK